jgi:hypothetical protein
MFSLRLRGELACVAANVGDILISQLCICELQVSALSKVNELGTTYGRAAVGGAISLPAATARIAGRSGTAASAG